MLTYRTLTHETYAALRYQVLLNAEETGDPKETAYLDSKGIPTIGIGFNLKTNFLAVLNGFDFNTTVTQVPAEAAYIKEIKDLVNESYASNAALNADLNEVMSRHFADTSIPAANRTRSAFQFLNDTEIRGVFDGLIESYETKVNNWFAGIPESPERAILASLAWNNAGKLLGNGLKTALQTGNRAEAWFEIRYNSNGDKLGGIAKRRYYESEVFGLTDNPAA
jgi:GH24 family phage-related lysozyme (muramidase)